MVPKASTAFQNLAKIPAILLTQIRFFRPYRRQFMTVGLHFDGGSRALAASAPRPVHQPVHYDTGSAIEAMPFRRFASRCLEKFTM